MGVTERLLAAAAAPPRWRWSSFAISKTGFQPVLQAAA